MNDDLDLPFEAQTPTNVQLNDANITAGVVILAAFVPVPDVGMRPALVYRFAKPDGTGFYPPFVLISEADQMQKLTALTDDAVKAAIQAART